jgi:hypothetical protein
MYTTSATSDSHEALAYNVAENFFVATVRARTALGSSSRPRSAS